MDIVKYSESHIYIRKSGLAAQAADVNERYKKNFDINSDVTWTCICDCQPIREETAFSKTPCCSGRAVLLSN